MVEGHKEGGFVETATEVLYWPIGWEGALGKGISADDYLRDRCCGRVDACQFETTKRRLTQGQQKFWDKNGGLERPPVELGGRAGSGLATERQRQPSQTHLDNSPERFVGDLA